MSQVPAYREFWDLYGNLGHVPEETLNQILELFGESGRCSSSCFSVQDTSHRILIISIE